MYRTVHNFFLLIKNPKTHQKPAGNARTGFLEVSGGFLDVPLLTGPHGIFFSRKAAYLKFALLNNNISCNEPFFKLMIENHSALET